MNRFFTLLLAASCLTAVGQVEMQLRYLTSEVHPPRSTEMSFSGANGLIDYTPLEWGGAPCGTCESSSSTDFSAPFPFGFSTNCSDAGWIFPVNGYLRFNLGSVPNSMSIHTSWTGCCRATEIEIAFRQGSLWQPIDTVQYLGEGCGWQHLPFASSGLLTGCTQQDACNYNSDAQVDDGSCHFLCQFCQDGTMWDEEIQGCISANTADINNDGCVQLNDLLDLLSAYGDCGTEESPWQCGDPLEYQGYDYETVQIGEQCWFAENLRAESYRNGDSLQYDLSDIDWITSQEGALTVYGAESGCTESVPEFDACDPMYAYDEYGLLYNWWSISDSRKICPIGWSTPTVSDWELLTSNVGGSSSAGLVLKSSQGWSNQSGNNGNGLNSVLFTAKPGGYLWGTGSEVDNYQAGIGAYWWAQDSDLDPYAYYLKDFTDESFTSTFSPQHGFSVRCIKDSE